MAILENFTLEHAGSLKDFPQLALGTHNATYDITLAHVGITAPGEVLRFKQVHDEYVEAIRKKSDHVLRTGGTTQQIEQDVDSTYKTYTDMRKLYSNDPSLAFLNKPIHRKEFDISPYPVAGNGKHMPPQPYLGATSAQDGLWPGYDKPEYLEHYPFLRRYQNETPGKALQTFLKKHNLFYHFPETVSRYGVLFVPPPYLDDDTNIELRQHLSTCDPLYHTAPKVSLSTTVEEARLVLSYVEDDMVAVVEDGGEVVGIIDWRDVMSRPAGDIVGSFMRNDWHEAPKEKQSAQAAFEHLEKQGWQQMIKFTEHGPRIVTQTTAAVSHFLPPHLYKGGLGSALYFGISDVREGDRLIERLKTEANGVPAAFVETAHADTEYYRQILRHYRDKLRDVFLMAGTTISPEAVLDFLGEYEADGVKLGIAEGTACRTSRTGIALPNAHVGLECGAAAFEKGYLMLDGWGGPDEFIKGLSMSGIQMRQGGGAFMGRREAANPFLTKNGSRGKYYRGMAGADVQQAVMGQKDASLAKRMEARAHLHSEGAEIFVGQRSPSTVGRMLLSQKLLLQSAMSYTGVRAELEDPTKVPEAMQEKALHQFQRMARLYAVRPGA